MGETFGSFDVVQAINRAGASMLDGMLEGFRKHEEAAKPYRWTQTGEEELGIEQHGKYILTIKRLTWAPPEKTGGVGILFAGGPPDGIDENGQALRYYITGDEYREYDWGHVRGTRESADALLSWLQKRDAQMPAIERAIAVFKENGFHHGEYYSPCEQSVKCQQCVEAAMDVLALNFPQADSSAVQ